MGECIISGGGRTVYIAGSGGGSSATNLPVLNSSNPIDYTMKALETISLSVFIEENNVNCTYQWFVDNEMIYGATEAIYNYTPNTGTENITTHSIKCAVTNNKGTIYSRDAIITVYSTRYYIIKNYTIIDSSAELTTPYGSSEVKISGTMISSSTTGNKYAELTFDIPYNYYNSKIGVVYDSNSYYDAYVPIGIADNNNNYTNIYIIVAMKLLYLTLFHHIMLKLVYHHLPMVVKHILT